MITPHERMSLFACEARLRRHHAANEAVVALRVLDAQLVLHLRSEMCFPRRHYNLLAKPEAVHLQVRA